MSDYARANTGGATHFGDKDALTSGDSDKVIVGADYDTEFNAILTAVNSKYDVNDLATQAQAEGESLNTVLITPQSLGQWSDANGGMVGDVQAFTDQNVDTVFGWDDSAGAAIQFTVGTGLTSTAGGALEADILGLEDLSDPGADRIVFWDDSAGATAFLQVSTGLSLSGTSLTSDDANIDHDALSNFVADEHVDHTAVTLTAGDGLSGGGDISASRQFDLDISGLTTIDATGLSTTEDGFLVDNNGTPNLMSYTDSGIVVETVSGTTDTLATANMNTFIRYTNGSAVTVTLNTGVGTVGNFVIIKQAGAGQVSISGSATINAAVGANTRTQDSVIVLFCEAADTWALYGDQAA